MYEYPKNRKVKIQTKMHNELYLSIFHLLSPSFFLFLPPLCPHFYIYDLLDELYD